MPSDYNAITEYNEHQLGQDTASRKTQISMYSDPTHFVYEILQNADDYGATGVVFKLSKNELQIEHDGKPFTEENVRAITYFGKSTSRDDLVKTGRFGVGFKSVFAFTATPIIISDDEHFQIYGLYRVKEHSYPNGFLRSRTRIVLPFNHESEQPDYVEDLMSQEEAYSKISIRLTTLNMNTLLFTRNIREIRWEIGGRSGHYLREDDINDNARRTIITDGEHLRKYLVFSRIPRWKNQEYKAVEIVFGIDEKEQITSVDDFLYVLFATKQETHLQFILNGPYRTNPSRETVSEDDPFNLHLIKETCELVVESLQWLKEMDLLSVSLLEALPIRAEDFQEDSMFYPIFSRVKEALLSEELLPADDGIFVAASNAKLARGAELMKLLDRGQLQALFQSDGEIRWLPGRITQDRTPDLRLYLRNELKIDEIDPEVFARNLSKEFLVEQTDEWFIKFYQFLSTQKALWRPPRSGWEMGGILRNKPILRLQNGSHANPSRPNNSPIAYLATDTETSLPIVKVTLSSDEEARKFLQELGVPKLDIVAEVIGKILPKYMSDSAPVDPEENERDLKKIDGAYETDSKEKNNRLQDALRKTPFILAEYPNEGGRAYGKPHQVYFSREELQIYFSGNGSFACVNLDHPHAKLFKELGVSDHVRIQCESKPRSTTDVWLRYKHGCHRRGLKGFDPDISVDGLRDALETPSIEKSRIIWNKIAADYSLCVRGRIIRSSRQDFSRSASIYEEEERISENFGRLLIDAEWLPNSDGHLHKPSELTLDDLPESFVPDEKLADQLGMKKNVVAKLAEEAGISENALNRAKQIEDAPPEIQQQIDSLLQKEDKKKTQQQERVPYAKSLSETFSKPGKEKVDNNGTGGNGGSSPNPSRRREKISEDIAVAIENEGEREERSSFTLRKKWEGKNDQVRASFTEWYGGQCQICKKTFTQRNGTPYFEGLYLVSYTTAEWIDRVGNVLCLCAEHSAMFQFGPREVEEDIIQQVMWLKVEAEGGDGPPMIRMKLCGEPVEIKFAEKHLIDLQEIVKKSQELEHNILRVPPGNESGRDA